MFFVRSSTAALRWPVVVRSFSKARHRVCLGLVIGCLLTACGNDIVTQLQVVTELQQKGQFEKSIEPLREILKSVPEHAEANHLLGVALVQTGQPGLSVWPFEKAILDPSHTINSGLVLASVYLETKNFNEALRVTELVLEQDPKNTVALLTRARTNFVSTKYSDALSDVNRLIEVAPDHYLAHLVKGQTLVYLERSDEAELEYKKIRELTQSNPGLQEVIGWIELAGFYKSIGNQEALEKEVGEMLEAYPDDLMTLGFISEHYDGTDRTSEANAFWRRAIAAHPDQLAPRHALANRLKDQMKTDEAEEVYSQAAETINSAEAWLRLAEFQKTQANTGKAVEAMDRAVELAPAQTDQLRFEQADIYIDARDFASAEAIIEKIDETLYRDMLEGRILLLQGDAAAALKRFDAGIRQWPNNASARFLAGKAAYELGLYERAALELRESYRADPGRTDAAIVLAELMLIQGNYRSAIEFANYHLRSRKVENLRPKDHQAFWVLARAFSELGAFDRAEQILKEGEELGVDPVRTVLGQAMVEGKKAKAAGTSSALAKIRVIENTSYELVSEEEEPLLAMYVENALMVGREKDALERIRTALETRPDSANLNDMLGRALGNTNQLDEAEAAFRKALESEKEFHRALGGLATIARKRGQTDRAIELFDQAAKLDPQHGDYAYRKAQLLLQKGNRTEAMSLLRDVVKRDPSHASSRNDLAWLLAESETDLEYALELAKEAVRINSGPDTVDTLGWVYFKLARYELARKSYDAVLAENPQATSTRYRLGLTLLEIGDKERALAEFRTAVGGTDFPEAPQARALITTLEKESL